MRIRCKPWAKPELEACGFCINEPETLKGNGAVNLKMTLPYIWGLAAAKADLFHRRRRQIRI